MRLLLISYDLHRDAPQRRHEAIAEIITKSSVGECRQIMRYGWLVYTEGTPEEWGDSLKGHFGQGEHLIITQLHAGEGWTTRTGEVRAWMKRKL